MPELKRNHYVPRFILNTWATDGPKYRGTWVYDIRENRKYFSSASGGSGFSFAIDNDLYVPTIDGARAPAMERWFSRLEGSLSWLVKQAATQSETIAFQTQAEWVAATMGLFGLEIRSRYTVQLLRRAIEASPELRQFISANPERDSHRLILENIIHVVTELAGLYNPIQLTFVHADGTNLICCDRPFFNDSRLDQRFVGLTKTCLVAYEKSPAGTSRYRHDKARGDFFDTINKEIALNARDWIVAETEQQLDQYVAVVNSDEWKQRVASDKIEMLPLKTLTAGWSIPPEEKGDA